MQIKLVKKSVMNNRFSWVNMCNVYIEQECVQNLVRHLHTLPFWSVLLVFGICPYILKKDSISIDTLFFLAQYESYISGEYGWIDHTKPQGNPNITTVYPKKYAHGFVVLCFVVVMQSFIMNSHGVFIHIHQGCFAGTGAIFRLPQCQWSKPDGYGKISQCITTTKHSKAKTVCIFLGIYCTT